MFIFILGAKKEIDSSLSLFAVSKAQNESAVVWFVLDESMNDEHVSKRNLRVFN